MHKNVLRACAIIVALFKEHNIQPAHENCMNYGRMSWQHSLELIDQIPGLKLIYDTGNSPFMKDYSKREDVWQDGWEFYSNVKQHIEYIHIKDSVSPKGGQKEQYTMPGEGQGYVLDILKDLKSSSYDGGISIEPHLAAVFHDPSALNTSNGQSYDLYLEYGRRLMSLLDDIQYEYTHYSKNITV